jgi:polyphosphate kinase
MNKDGLQNRELSWLSFNERVLQEAIDKSNPLLERIRFLGIYSNNLDEFFRVRVANINRMISAGIRKLDGFDGTPAELLRLVFKVIKQQRKLYEATYQRLIGELEEHGVFHVNETNVSNNFKHYLQTYFLTELKQDIVPLILDKKIKFPRLVDKEIYLGIRMFQNEKKKTKFALIQVPSQHPRFITFRENDKTYVMLLDDVIRLFLKDIFSIFIFDSIEAHTFKFTRDAELDLDDDISVSMYDRMEESIEQRKKGEPLRFVYDENMPKDLLNLLRSALTITKTDHDAPGGRYHNSKDLMNFPQVLDDSFCFPKRPSLNHPDFLKAQSIIKLITEKDQMLHYPYQKFDHLIDFLREAAIDPKVKSIKISLYRIARKSQVINALINALRNGKQVVVVVELQARFDEENNMYWSNILRDHGARIIYGIPGFKVHAKLILVSRKSGKVSQKFAHIGTGNFHGINAKIYTDFSLLTADKLITGEVAKVFNFLENNIERTSYRSLMVSPFNTRRKFIALINNEIKNARKGKHAQIDIKINNLVDTKLIRKLYEAAEQGVKVRGIVRGVCCMKSGVSSKNISLKSVVGRYLEHGRLIIFHNDGNPQTFISSADWMTRNLDKRIEVTAPILDKDINKQLQHIFEMEWEDNIKSRIIDDRQLNRYWRKGESKLQVHEEMFKLYQST